MDDLYDQLETLRDRIQDVSHGATKSAGLGLSRARAYAADAAHDAEETMKDNLAASLVLAAGIGLVVGYLLRRGTE